MVGLPVIDFATPWAADPDEYFIGTGRPCRPAGRAAAVDLLRAACALHGERRVDAAPARLVEQLDVPVHMHVHETAQEVDESLQQYGQRPLARLQALGLVNRRLLAVP